MNRKFIRLLFLFFLTSSTVFSPWNGPGFCDTPHPGPTLQVTAIIEPYINISLSTDSIVFLCKGAPGIYDADKPVIVSVGSNCNNWIVKCKATSLKGTSGEISSNRIFVKTPNSINLAGPEVQGFEPMSNEIDIIEGAIAENKSATMEFKLKTTWEDKAGTYTGQINYTYLVNP